MKVSKRKNNLKLAKFLANTSLFSEYLVNDDGSIDLKPIKSWYENEWYDLEYANKAYGIQANINKIEGKLRHRIYKLATSIKEKYLCRKFTAQMYNIDDVDNSLDSFGLSERYKDYLWQLIDSYDGIPATSEFMLDIYNTIKN